MGRVNNLPWEKIFKDHRVNQHDFSNAPFFLDASEIKVSCQDFKKTGEKEPSMLCKQYTRESRPQVFKDKDLFILPTVNGKYCLIQGEGYLDIKPILESPQEYKSKVSFPLETCKIGDSGTQHLDLAYATSLIRTFVGDESLVMTIRDRKYSPLEGFSLYAGKHNHKISVARVQTRVDAGFEGQYKFVLVKAKPSKGSTANTIIRQLYYPYRQWQSQTTKEVLCLFFEKNTDKDSGAAVYSIWQYEFSDPNNYHSIKPKRAQSYTIKE